MDSDKIIQQAGFMIGGKVVCIADSHQRLDLFEAPDGLLVMGQVYCVSGFSDCGGLLLVGRRAIFASTGENVGFHPARFLPLEKFRAKYPQGISSISSKDRRAIEKQVTAAHPLHQLRFPEIEGLETPKVIVIQAIDILEEIHWDAAAWKSEKSWLDIGYLSDQSAKSVQKELRELLWSPQQSAAMKQSQALWQLLALNQKRILMFCRDRSPAASMLLHLCTPGNVFSEDLLQGCLKEADFPHLTLAAGKLAGSPIRVCDARDPEVFLRVLFDAHPHFDCIMCDWPLADAELTAATRMTRDSKIEFLCPEE